MFTRRTAGVFLSILLLLIVVPSAMAFEGRDGDQVVIGQGEVIDDDLYIAGDTLTIDGTVNGDLFAFGNEIVVNGTVNGDVFAAGTSLTINGTVTDDVRSGGTAVIVADGASVGGDLLVGGYGVEVADGAQVSGDVLFGAYGARLDGAIGGDVTGGGLGIEIGGSIAGDVELGVGSDAEQAPFDPLLFNPNVPEDLPRVAAGLRISDDATIGGSLQYESREVGKFSADSISGDVTHDQTVAEVAATPSFAERLGSRMWSNVQQWIVLVLIGWLLLRFVPTVVRGSADKISSETGGSVVAGVLLLIGVPILLTVGFIVMILLAVLFGVISLGAISAIIVGFGIMLLSLELIVYVLVLVFLGNIIVGWLIGKRIVSGDTNPIVPLAVGTLIIMLLSAIPIIGGIIGLIVGVLGLGALWLWWRGRNAVETVDPIKPMAAV